jgi:hypothetical protein
LETKPNQTHIKTKEGMAASLWKILGDQQKSPVLIARLFLKDETKNAVN